MALPSIFQSINSIDILAQSFEMSEQGIQFLLDGQRLFPDLVFILKYSIYILTLLATIQRQSDQNLFLLP